MPTRGSRRGFLRTTGLVAAGAVFGTSQPAWAADAWDQVPVILGRIKPPTFPDKDFPVTSYGAKPDGTTDSTAAFAKAVNAASQAGGGRVVVRGGTFRTGGITLLSNVNLFVDKGATIRFSTDPKRYLPIVPTRWQGIECMNYQAFVYANGQTNVALTGTGTLDGQGRRGRAGAAVARTGSCCRSGPSTGCRSRTASSATGTGSGRTWSSSATAPTSWSRA